MPYGVAVFYVLDVDRTVGIVLTLFYGSLSTDPILFTCVPHHLTEL